MSLWSDVPCELCYGDAEGRRPLLECQTGGAEALGMLMVTLKQDASGKMKGGLSSGK